jgi:magnesium transporter
MGLALGVTLGVIAFARGALTPSDTRSGPRKVKEEFTVRVKAGTKLTAEESTTIWGGKNWDVALEKNTPQTVKMEKNARVRLPDGEKALDPPTEQNGDWEYKFPAQCEVRTEPVSRWKLGLTIAIAVLGICLWGTLMGCIIPLVLRAFGTDPAVASGALVATLVDVTGIAIFFTAAWLILL